MSGSRLLHTALVRLLGPTGGWKRRVAGLSLGIGAAAGLAAAQTLKPSPFALARQPIAISATPIASFDTTDAGRTRFGRLEWRSGVSLTAPSPNFGGWSGLVVGADGRSLVAVSDAGTYLTGDLTYTAGGALKGISRAEIAPLKARDGSTLARRRDRDAESIVLESGSLTNGTVLVSFEQNDRIGRFPIGSGGLGAPSDYLSLPPEVKTMRLNGLEAVAVMAGGRQKGRIVALAEEPTRDGRHQGWIWDGSNPQRFTIEGADGFSVTDAKSLPDGSLIVLERSFRWLDGVKMRLSRLSGDRLAGGATLKRDVLMSADMGQNIDNMEGLAISTNAAGETILTLISDNNFNGLFQKTVLLQFALDTGSERAGTAVSAQSTGRAKR